MSLEKSPVPDRLDTVLASAAIGAVLASTLYASVEFDTSSASATEAAPAPAVAESTACQPSAQEIADVRALLAKPARVPALLNDEGYAAPVRPVYSANDPRLPLANELGLTLYKLPKTPVSPETPPDKRGDIMLKTTQKFAGQYGITVSLLAKKEAGDDSRPLTADELDTDTALNVMSSLQLELSSEPAEYFKAIGLRAIKLYALKTAPDGTAVLGYMIPADHDGTVYIDVTNSGSAEAFPHEAAHVADEAECGQDMSRDFAYAKLARDNMYGPNTSEHTDDYYNQRLDNYNNQRRYGLRQTITTAQLDELAAAVTVVSDYSMESTAEDKAELGARISQPNSYHDIFDPRKPRLREKAVLLLARLHHLAPKVAEFFIATATRPS